MHFLEEIKPIAQKCTNTFIYTLLFGGGRVFLDLTHLYVYNKDKWGVIYGK